MLFILYQAIRIEDEGVKSCTFLQETNLNHLMTNLYKEPVAIIMHATAKLLLEVEKTSSKCVYLTYRKKN
jgi:hypothetical protein